MTHHTPPREPIAIIGIGCRFPGGVTTYEELWQLLLDGTDATCDIPADRWNIERYYDPNEARPGMMYVKRGGFLTQRIHDFDAHFFDITPREAAVMDPQQRLLLEVTWEALEDAGIVPSDLSGSPTGVYIGGFTLDNKLTQITPENRHEIGPHTAVGSTMTILSNRISYLLDLKGPSISIDTACSSSLAALHHACNSLWLRETSLALAGGVNVILRPELMVAMCKGKFLSPDGRSKSFDERANGYGRGEGAGILVVKRYSEALQDGDTIHAIIRATGLNQDGRTPGITVPSEESQRALVQEVMDRARVHPSQLSFVEAHGTGTPVGDPIEARALGLALGAERDAPCYLTSIKSSIGHLEAAAGVAGVIKAALSLKKRGLPPIANLRTPTTKIDFEGLNLSLPTEVIPLPELSFAGVNSFGYGGTNGHVILESPPQCPLASPLTPSFPGKLPLLLSARSVQALRDLAGRYEGVVDEHPLEDVAYSSALHREHFEERVAITTESIEKTLEALKALKEGREHEGYRQHRRLTTDQRGPVFVFSGMGPQWWAMGRKLLTIPAARRKAEQCDEIFKKLAGWSILEELSRDESSSRISDTTVAQPANFLLQVALIETLIGYGIQPAAVVGHSVGEVTSLYVSGVLTLEEAVLVSYQRSRIQKKAAGIGSMLAVALTRGQAEEIVRREDNRISIAAINSPTAVTLSGDTEVLERISSELSNDGIFSKVLSVEVAYHSPTMEPLREELLSSLSPLSARAPTLPLYSTVTGERVQDAIGDGTYWYENIRNPVYFREAIQSLSRDGYSLFLEIGPHPVLSRSITESVEENRGVSTVLSTLKRDEDDLNRILELATSLYLSGVLRSPRALYEGSGRRIRLPYYPWQRERHWHEAERSYLKRTSPAPHPFLGTREAELPHHYSSSLDHHTRALLEDHRVDGSTVVPGAAYVETALRLAQEITGEFPLSIADLSFMNALLLDNEEQRTMNTTYEEENGYFSISSTNGSNLPPTHHAKGRIVSAGGTPPSVEVDALHASLSIVIEKEAHYENMRDRGLEYESHFQLVSHLKVSPDRSRVLAFISTECHYPFSHTLLLPPPQLDAAFQALLQTLESSNRELYVPIGIRRVTLLRKAPSSFLSYATRIAQDEGTIEGDILLLDQAGEIFCVIEGVRAQRLTRQDEEVKDLSPYYYHYGWDVRANMSPFSPTRSLLLVGNEPGRIAMMRDLLQHQLNGLGGSITTLLQDEESGEDLIDKAEEVIYLAPLSLLKAERSFDPIGRGLAEKLLPLLQAFVRRDRAATRFTLVVTGSSMVTSEDRLLHPAHAPLVGLLRVAMNEYPELSFRVIDIDGTVSPKLLIHELLHPGEEEECAMRGTSRYVRRLRAVEELSSLSRSPSSTNYTLTFHRKSRQVTAKGAHISRLDPHCIRCATRLSHFIRSEISTPHYLPHSARLVVAQVAEVGSKVYGYKVGQEVLALTSGPLQRLFDITPEALLPSPQDDKNLAAILIAAIARYAVKDVVKARARERVMVITEDEVMRQYLDAELREVGAKVQMHKASRMSLDEAPVDVVISSRTEVRQEDVEKALRPGGRLVLIPTASVNSSPSLVNRSVSVVDPDGLIEDTTFLDRILEVLEEPSVPSSAVIYSLPEIESEGVPEEITAYDMIALDAPLSVPPLLEKESLSLSAKGSYLITGGFGGFGLLLAEWLVKNGARHLVLVGRGGARTPEARASIEAMRQGGCHIREELLDVGHELEVQRLIQTIDQEMPPLSAVFHAAAVLDDAPIAFITEEQLDKVLSAKAQGAWNLHLATRSHSLDYFVLFSSLTSLIGAPGQGTYVAANCFLDSLAEYRMAMGLPITSINWGALGEVGMVTKYSEVAQYFERVGIHSLSPADALAGLKEAMTHHIPSLSIAVVDWKEWGEFNPAWQRSPRYASLIEAPRPAGEGGTLEVTLSTLDDTARESTIRDMFLVEIGRVLKVPTEKIDPGRSLTQIGLDSLIAMELQSTIHKVFKVKLSTLELMKGTPIVQVARTIASKLAREVSNATV